ncbi:MAG: (2Fe-2S) ferredoxin domain-containing protein [Chloroflexia bacterium]
MATTARIRAYVCCGPRCTEQRSPELIDVLQREVDRAGLGAEVEVLPGGCQKHCECGPSLAIWPGPFYYEHLDARRIARIVREHFSDGRPVREWFYREPLPLLDPRLPHKPYTPPQPAPTAARPAPAGRQQPQRPARPKPEVDDFKW